MDGPDESEVALEPNHAVNGVATQTAPCKTRALPRHTEIRHGPPGTRGPGMFHQRCRELVAEYEYLQAYCREISKHNVRLMEQVRHSRVVPEEPATNVAPPTGAPFMVSSTSLTHGMQAKKRNSEASVEAEAMAGALEVAATLAALEAEAGSHDWIPAALPLKIHRHSEAIRTTKLTIPDGDPEVHLDFDFDGWPAAVVPPSVPPAKMPLATNFREGCFSDACTGSDPPVGSDGDSCTEGMHGILPTMSPSTSEFGHALTSNHGVTFSRKDQSYASTARKTSGKASQACHSHERSSTTRAQRESRDLKELEREFEAKASAEKPVVALRAERLETLIRGQKLDRAQAFCNNILKHWLFDFFIGVVIIANSVTIGIESSMVANGEETLPLALTVLEPVFLTIYILELLDRLFVYGPRVLRDTWVLFDFVLVVCGIVGLVTNAVMTDVTDGGVVFENIMLVRTMRLLRLARAVRLLVQFRTLWLLVQGLIHSCTTLCWTFVIMFSLIYVFAIVGLEIVHKDPSAGPDYQEKYKDHFSRLDFAMLTLLQVLTLDSVGQIYTPLIVAKPELAVYFVAFILLASIALTNLVTAIMVESSMAQAHNDKEGRAQWLNARKKAMIPKLKEIFYEMDKDGSQELQLNEVLEAPSWVKEQLTLLANLGDIEEIFHMIDYDGSGAVTIEEFVDGITKANSANKPLELIRIMKQCGDILRYSKLIWFALESSLSSRADPNVRRTVSVKKHSRV